MDKSSEMNSRITLLYIGNKLSKHGLSLSNVETLGKQLGYTYNIITVSDKKNKLLRLLDMIWSIIRDRKKVSLILIDTFSTSSFYYAFICAYVASIMKLPYIPILHGGNLPFRLKNNKKMSRFLFGNAARNVAPSKYLQHAFKKYGFGTIYIPNNIDITKYPYKKRVVISPHLLYVRALDKIYNPTMAVDVLANVMEVYPEAVLCMVGPDKDGSLVEVLERAKQLGVEKQLTITGKLEKEVWVKLSENYDIFINTTNYDNQPVSVIEAMALGFPIVSTNAGGLPYLITDGHDGLLVDKNEVTAMSEKIKYLLRNSSVTRKLSVNARKKAELFDWQSVRKKWEDLIENKEK